MQKQHTRNTYTSRSLTADSFDDLGPISGPAAPISDTSEAGEVIYSTRYNTIRRGEVINSWRIEALVDYTARGDAKFRVCHTKTGEVKVRTLGNLNVNWRNYQK